MTTRTPVPRETRARKMIYKGDPLSEAPPPQVAEIIERHAGTRDGLITALQELQEVYGYLPERPLRYLAHGLRLPMAQVYGVATFYNQFRLTPRGKYLLRVCRGTACHVSHSATILDALQEHLGVAEDQSTEDGLFTLQTVACMGSCSLAPVLAVDEMTYGRMTPEEAVRITEVLRDAEIGATP